ncbi:hypothetical protein KAW38_03095 [Candidatus Micrarchaeota archaeon]|nr:hypothetical protein [Candidatus Micrarchaeota archaeon]
MNLKPLILFGVFTLICFGLLSLDVFQLWGSSQTFSLFQFSAPISMAVFSPVLGAVSILIVEVLGRVFSGNFAFDLFSILRFLPLLFAALYFAEIKNRKWIGFVLPIFGILLFWFHPIGLEAWGYALLWTIPLVTPFFSENLFMRSLGSTFQAHIVGSLAFLYTIGMGASLWWALIPVVLVERLVFASGISLTYIFYNSLVEFVHSRFRRDLSSLHTEKKYALFRVKE